MRNTNACTNNYDTTSSCIISNYLYFETGILDLPEDFELVNTRKQMLVFHRNDDHNIKNTQDTQTVKNRKCIKPSVKVNKRIVFKPKPLKHAHLPRRKGDRTRA